MSFSSALNLFSAGSTSPLLSKTRAFQTYLDGALSAVSSATGPNQDSGLQSFSISMSNEPSIMKNNSSSSL